MPDPILHLDDFTIGKLNEISRARMDRNKQLRLSQSFGRFDPAQKDAHRKTMALLKDIYQQAQKDEEVWMAGKPVRIDKMKSFMFLQIQIHMLGWVEKVDEAVNSASEPPEKNAFAYWVISLVGNLVWAATALNGISQNMKVFMSFAGAAVGSGVVEKSVDAVKTIVLDTPENRKDYVKGEIGNLQSIMEQDYKGRRFQWAEELDGDPKLRSIGDGFDEYVEQFLWNKMFQVPYAPQKDGSGRYHQVFIEAKKNMEILLGLLRDQWDDWKKDQTVGPASFRFGIYPPKYGKPFILDLSQARKGMATMIR